MEFIKENISWIAPVGGWVLAVLAFIITPVRDWIVGKVSLSLDKARDKNKAINDKKIYVSKARFDKEFLCYQELSECFIPIVYDSSDAYNFSVKRERSLDDYYEFLENFTCNVNRAGITLNKYAPFISKEIYMKYKQLYKDICTVYDYSKNLYYVRKDKNKKKDSKSFSKGKSYGEVECCLVIDNTSNKVEKSLNDIINDVREYLNSLDVIE